MALTATIADVNIETDSLTLVLVVEGVKDTSKEVLTFAIDDSLTLDSIRAGIVELGARLQVRGKQEVNFSSLLGEVIKIPEAK